MITRFRNGMRCSFAVFALNNRCARRRRCSHLGFRMHDHASEKRQKQRRTWSNYRTISVSAVPPLSRGLLRYNFGFWQPNAGFAYSCGRRMKEPSERERTRPSDQNVATEFPNPLSEAKPDVEDHGKYRGLIRASPSLSVPSTDSERDGACARCRNVSFDIYDFAGNFGKRGSFFVCAFVIKPTYDDVFWSSRA